MTYVHNIITLKSISLIRIQQTPCSANVVVRPETISASQQRQLFRVFCHLPEHQKQSGGTIKAARGLSSLNNDAAITHPLVHTQSGYSQSQIRF